MIDERLDRDPLRKLLHPADMVDVVVRADQIIDLFHARVGDGRHDAIGITAARIPAVHEHRLARRRDPQRRLSAFGVDDVDLQGTGTGRRLLGRR